MTELTIGGQKMRSSARSYGGDSVSHPRALRAMPAPRGAIGGGRPPARARPLVGMPKYGPRAQMQSMRSRSFKPRAPQGSGVGGVFSAFKKALRIGR